MGLTGTNIYLGPGINSCGTNPSNYETTILAATVSPGGDLGSFSIVNGSNADVSNGCFQMSGATMFYFAGTDITGTVISNTTSATLTQPYSGFGDSSWGPASNFGPARSNFGCAEAGLYYYAAGGIDVNTNILSSAQHVKV